MLFQRSVLFPTTQVKPGRDREDKSVGNNGKKHDHVQKMMEVMIQDNAIRKL